MHAHQPAPDRAGAASPAAAAHVEEHEFVELVRSGLTVAEVAWATGLSARQVKRRKATLGLTAYDYGSLEQDMALVAQVVEHAPSINLDDGYRQVAACLRSLNVNMGEKRVQAALARLYPEAVYERRNYLQRRIRRGPQHYKYFFHVWNTDLNLKLFPLLGIYFAGCVDAYSKMLIYLRVHTDKLSTTVASFYLSAAAEYGGVPDRLVADYGGEAFLSLFITDYAAREWEEVTGQLCTESAAHQTKSVHNQPVEKFWGEVNDRITHRVKLFLPVVEQRGWSIDVSLDLGIMHLILIPVLQTACDEYQKVRCHRRIQGKGRGVPIRQAMRRPRPSHLHRNLPNGTLDDWVERYTAAGGKLPTVAEGNRRVEDLLVDALSSAGQDALAGAVALRNELIWSVVPSAEDLWTAISKGGSMQEEERESVYEPVLTAFDIARAITDEMATVADVLSHKLSWQEYIDAATGEDSHHIRQLLAERLFDFVDVS